MLIVTLCQNDSLEKWKNTSREPSDSLDTVHTQVKKSEKIDRQDSQRGTTPRIIPNSLAKGGVAEGTHYTCMNSNEKANQNLIVSNLYDPTQDPN